MKKFFTVISLILLFCLKLVALTGPLSKEKDLRLVQTKWFDIIYPKRAEQMAAMLYENADQIYEEVAGFMCTTQSFRIPVVIAPAVEAPNAFFNPFPYNHIVLYDTSTVGTANLQVYSNQFLSIFRHELTHAVTFNMKNDFWSAAGRVFGDAAALGYLSISTGLAEGPTVSSESAQGEGRLNDEYSKHAVKQAKIEGKFPSYFDSQGCSTMLPVGHPYFFNGAFVQYLQKKYGLEPYAKFWYYTVNAQKGRLKRRFKAAFGVDIRTAWKDFEETYPVPEVLSNPVHAKLVQDFFEPASNDYSRYNNQGACYASLCACEKGIFFLEEKSGRVLFVERAALNAEPERTLAEQKNKSHQKIKPQVLVTMPSAYEVNCSQDGRFAVISYYSTARSTVKARVAVYDTSTRKLHKIKIDGLKAGSVLCRDGECYLVAAKYETPYNTIQVFKLNDIENKVNPTLAAKLVLPLNTSVQNFVPLAEGDTRFACVYKEEMNYSVGVCAFDENKAEIQLLSKFSIPEERCVIRSLSLSQDDKSVLYFSWAKPDTLPRAGSLNLKTGSLSLGTRDLSGGIFTPVFINGELIYVGSFYEQHRLLCLPEGMNSEIMATIADKADKLPEPEAGFSVKTDSLSANETLLSEKFKPYKYYTKGVFLPLGLYQTEFFGINESHQSSYNTSFLGASYLTSNPWNNLKDDLYLLTCGYNILDSSFGFEFRMLKGTDTSLLNTTTSLKTEFDSNGWKQSGAIFEATSSIPFGTISNLILAGKTRAMFGRQDNVVSDSLIENLLFNQPGTLFGLTKATDSTVYYSLSEIVGVGYSNIHKTGSGVYQKLGFKTQLSAGFWYYGGFGDAEKNGKDGKGSCVFELANMWSVYIPQLLPVINEHRYTVNLPSRIDVKLFPGASTYAYSGATKNDVGRSLVDFETETVLFAYEVQKSIPFFTGLYLNSITLSGGYAASLLCPSGYSKTGFSFSNLNYYMNLLSDGKLLYFNSVYLRFMTNCSPNIGRLAGYFNFNFYSQFTYAFHNKGFNDGFLVSVGMNGGF